MKIQAYCVFKKNISLDSNLSNNHKFFIAEKNKIKETKKYTEIELHNKYLKLYIQKK